MAVRLRQRLHRFVTQSNIGLAEASPFSTSTMAAAQDTAVPIENGSRATGESLMWTIALTAHAILSNAAKSMATGLLSEAEAQADTPRSARSLFAIASKPARATMVS